MTHIILAQYGGLTYDTTLSPPCAKVHMALHLKGIEFEIKNCKTPGDVKRFNSRGRMPALSIDGQIFVDSSDILTEIDRRWPDPPLLPSSAMDQARCKMIEDWSDEVLYFYGVWLRWMVPASLDALRKQYFSKLPFPLSKLVPILAQRSARARLMGQGTGIKPEEVIRRELREGLQMIDQLVEAGQFLCGPQLTRADISVAALIDQFTTALTPKVNRIDFDGLPKLEAWLDRVHGIVPNVAER